MSDRPVVAAAPLLPTDDQSRGLAPALSIPQFWQAALRAAPALQGRSFDVWRFGDNAALADHLLAAVLHGRKRATASLLWVYESAGEALPGPGDVSIITDASDRPRAVIVVQQVEVRPFNEIDAKFAGAEGFERDPLAAWRDAHWRYFSRQCAELGRPPSADMPVVCEYFDLVYPVGNQETGGGT